MRQSERAGLVMLLFILVTSLLHSGNTPAVQPAPRPAPPQHFLLVQRTGQGDILRLRLKSAPFPHPGRQNGYQFEETRYPADPHYVDSTVIVFVPRKFRAASRVNLVFFFHGWNSSIDDAQQKFDLYRQFSRAACRLFSCCPSSRGTPRTHSAASSRRKAGSRGWWMSCWRRSLRTA